MNEKGKEKQSDDNRGTEDARDGEPGLGEGELRRAEARRPCASRHATDGRRPDPAQAR